jgi:short-subunit dehydrogenase
MTNLANDFKEKYGPWAFIAGGSEGIGAACAELVAEQGINLVLLARRKEPLKQMAAAIKEKYAVEVRILPQDLTADDLMHNVNAATTDIAVGLLLCISGSNTRAVRFLDEKVSDITALIKRNTKAPMLLAHHFGQGMRERSKGGMLFCTSLAGLAGCAFQAVYSATKAFNQMLAESLWHDLNPFGIDAICLAVGATRTPTVANLDMDDSAMNPEEVAIEGLSQLGKVPFWAAGEHNRAALPIFQGPDRESAIDLLSAGTAALFGLQHIPVTKHR